MILILTHRRDGSTDMVEFELKKRGANFVRFNTEEFPQRVKVAVSLNTSLSEGYFCFDDRKVYFSEVNCVWNRRPHPPQIDPIIYEPEIREWAEDESQQGLWCALSLLEDRFWINPRLSQDRVQFNKWIQMIAAKEVGFEIPSSLLTNDVEAAENFWLKEDKDIAIKVIKRGVIHYLDGRTTIIHTRRIRENNFRKDKLNLVGLTPIFLQKYISKKVEIRVTVVGEKIFACEINSQVDPFTTEDWRGHIFSRKVVPHKQIRLPLEIENKCRLLVRRLGLIFGAIDLILTPDEKYIFLEINPNGQWGWIEQLTGMPIAKEIAELLIEADKK